MIQTKIFIANKKAFYNYTVDKKYLAGIQLLGHEVKSIRLGRANLDNSYVNLKNNEVFILDMFIDKYISSNFFDYQERRPKKLLLQKKEIIQIQNKIKTKGFAVIPLKIIAVRNLLKLEIGLAKGKKKYDQRATLKKKDADLKIKKALNEFYS